MASQIELPPIDYRARLERLRSRCRGLGIDALLVTAKANIRYITGWPESGTLIVTSTASMLIISAMDAIGHEFDSYEASGSTVIPYAKRADLQRMVSGCMAGSSLIGVEADELSVATLDGYRNGLLKGLNIVETRGLIEELRAVKEGAEVARIRRAAQISHAAYWEVRWAFASLPPDRHTEVEFAAAFDAECLRAGGDDRAYQTIVGSGLRSALPHAHPTSRRMQRGDFRLFDGATKFDGYCADMSRSDVLGGQPSDQQQRMLAAVAAAQQASYAVIRAGALCRDVDVAARTVLRQHGFDPDTQMPHLVSHGIGLDVHELPRMRLDGEARLAAGHVITVEPGVYIEGFGGARIEDIVLVTETGYELLTPTDPAE